MAIPAIRADRIRMAGNRFDLDGLDANLSHPGLVAFRAELAEAKDWPHYLSTFPKPYLLNAFVGIMDKMQPEQYWSCLGNIWVMAEGAGFNKSTWLALFNAEISGRHMLMEPGDHAAFEKLPEKVLIFRGAPEKYARGMSWTTDRERAVWFSRRFTRENMVFTATVPKRKFLAYFCGARKENEAVIDPRRIRVDAA